MCMCELVNRYGLIISVRYLIIFFLGELILYGVGNGMYEFILMFFIVLSF